MWLWRFPLKDTKSQWIKLSGKTTQRLYLILLERCTGWVKLISFGNVLVWMNLLFIEFHGCPYLKKFNIMFSFFLVPLSLSHRIEDRRIFECNRQIHFVVFYFHQIFTNLMVYHHLIDNDINYHVYVYHSFCHYPFHKSWFVQFRAVLPVR